jgi:hypothetical protein
MRQSMQEIGIGIGIEIILGNLELQDLERQ